MLISVVNANLMGQRNEKQGDLTLAPDVFVELLDFVGV
jgi:hypothetical protein